MSILHFFLKESKGMHKDTELISKFVYNKKHAPFYENTCSLDKFDEKLNHTKFLKF